MAGEKNFEKRIKAAVTERGGWWCKYHGDAFSTAGVPDLLCCVDGRFVGIEVKDDDGEPSELQIWTIKQIRKAGGKAVILFPSAFSSFLKWMDSDFKAKKPIVMK